MFTCLYFLRTLLSAYDNNDNMNSESRVIMLWNCFKWFSFLSGTIISYDRPQEIVEETTNVILETNAYNNQLKYPKNT